ncbi:oxidoreductase family protein [Obba rivulosa]|uniref:Oxidoreductase family protein n=1 Tax=Obba rivulosa TaxID=1052685 RepID=A0A8E2B2P2_9APHY|nr:oxidoreductase family protein [Obba rivulosa]
MSPPGLAILGSGIFAKEAHLPAIAALGSARVALKAIYSRSETGAAGLAADAQDTLKLDAQPDIYFDADPARNLDALLARPDILGVIVVLPITTQPAIVLKALAAGKHVLSEKPVAPDVPGGLALIQEYETVYKPKGLVWRVAENFEAEPGYQAAAQAIKDGKIGKVTFFNARVVNYIDKNSKWYNTPWRTVPDYQGGFLLDGGVHTIAALRILLPSPLQTLSGFASLAKDYLAPHDTINAAVQTSDGAHGLVELTWGAPTPSRAANAAGGLTVTGTKGWLAINQVQAGGGSVLRTTVYQLQTDADGKEVGETEEVIEKRVMGVEVEIGSFLDAVAGTDDGIGSPRGALSDVAFIEAALNSNGAPVDLLKLVGAQ